MTTARTQRYPVTLLVVGLLAGVLVAACGDDGGASTTTRAATTVATTQAPTTVASTTSVPVSVTPVAVKTPAGSVDELVVALYAALDAYDDEAFRALSTDGARHAVFFYDGTGHGEITANFAVANYRLAASGIESIEILGDPIVSGEAVAIPVRYRYPEGDYVGFDVIIAEQQTGGGVLISGGVTFLADPDLAADPTAIPVIETEVAAWNAGGAAGVLATMHDDAAFWDDLDGVDPTTLYTGSALENFISTSLWFNVEITAEPTTSGPFIAVPNRLTASGDSSEGISIFLIRDGKIALHAYAQ